MGFHRNVLSTRVKILDKFSLVIINGKGKMTERERDFTFVIDNDKAKLIKNFGSCAHSCDALSYPIFAHHSYNVSQTNLDRF